MDFEHETGIFRLNREEIRVAPEFPKVFSISEGEIRLEELSELTDQIESEMLHLLMSPIHNEKAKGRELAATYSTIGHMCAQLTSQLEVNGGIIQLEEFLREM